MKILKKVINNFFDLVFPRECLGCGDEGAFVCDECLRGIDLKRDFPCVVCGKEAFFGRTHEGCLDKTNIDGVLCATDYKDELAGKMIRTFKYNLVRGLGPSLGWVMMRYLRGLMGHSGLGKKEMVRMVPGFLKFEDAPPHPVGGQTFAHLRGGEGMHHDIEGGEKSQDKEKPILIPIPLHPRRLRERGFNQAEILAREISKYFNWDVLTDVLTRKRYTTAQVNLKAHERAKNLKNAFDEEIKKYRNREIKDDDASIIKNRTVILIDDVLTTGATLNEAGKVLKDLGVNEVWGVCLAKD